jgi:hypothetical protein
MRVSGKEVIHLIQLLVNDHREERREGRHWAAMVEVLRNNYITVTIA